jgi:LmbE family N-acetylglucosaminyl deacetylase
MIPSRLERLLVLSPHCDDAVFSCGRLLESHPGSLVATAFAGRPPLGRPLTEWDAASGFRAGDDVMGLRRAEDRAALTLLGAQPIWMEFLDSQYGASPSVGELAEALHGLLSEIRPSAVLFPLGLFHSDHALMHEAALRLVPCHPERSWFVYEEAFYRRIPGLVLERLRTLERERVRLREVLFPLNTASDRKREALFCYRSQLRALMTPGRPGFADALERERFWRVEGTGR